MINLLYYYYYYTIIIVLIYKTSENSEKCLWMTVELKVTSSNVLFGLSNRPKPQNILLSVMQDNKK